MVSSVDARPASVCETEGADSSIVSDVNNDDTDDYFADVGFMFDSCHKSKLETVRFPMIAAAAPADHSNNKSGSCGTPRRVQVSMHVVADETPGALQSGHYLWPGAKLLASYLVANAGARGKDTAGADTEAGTTESTEQQRLPPPPTSIVELGSGCALASLTALQIWQESLRLVVVTDHDPGTLVRARDNLESTLQGVLDESESSLSVDGIGGDGDGDDVDNDAMLNDTINCLASIPVLFEPLEWGSADDAERVLRLLHEHSCCCSSSSQRVERVDLVLGSDLLYCPTVVEPLLRTASSLLLGNNSGSSNNNNNSDGDTTGRFVLAQSCMGGGAGNGDHECDAVEEEIDRVCNNLNLTRTVLYDHQSDGDDGSRKGRIVEFTHRKNGAQ
jgi:hypothetical protein